MSDDEKVTNLDRVRRLRAFQNDTSVAFVEFLWGEQSFAVNCAIRDLEAIRRGTEDPEKPLRDPETVFEAQVLIDRMRWMTNYLARQWGLEERVRPEDWQGDEREVPPE